MEETAEQKFERVQAGLNITVPMQRCKTSREIELEQLLGKALKWWSESLVDAGGDPWPQEAADMKACREILEQR